MNNPKSSPLSSDEKERIRHKYRGAVSGDLVVIPAIEEPDFYQDDSEKRVAVYARVSTGDPRQTSSFELQQTHYEDMVLKRPGWKLIDIYADEGISGTSLKKRDAFNRMFQDCMDGKIDLIVTKSVSRFARNVYDCIGCVRQLAALANPVGIFFENEQIYTLKPDNEMSLTFLATLAQEESRTKSNSMNLSYDMRFSREIFLTPELLGYDVNDDGDLVINDDEALTVRLIFFMYLYGYSCQQISETLMRLRRLTKKGNSKWSAGTVLSILQNERHCGDVLARKTWTPNYLDHKSKKNRGKRKQYLKSGHHEPIISRDDYIATQQLIANAKYGYKGVLPTLRVISDGALCGFVIVNMRWGGFDREDYLEAANSVTPIIEEIIGSIEENVHEPKDEPDIGEFDLRGYELVRTQFLGDFREPLVIINIHEIHFFAACFTKIEKTAYIELLLNPVEKLLVVRPCTKDSRNAVQWAKITGDRYFPREIHGAGFLNVLYEILDWEKECRYRIRGVRQQNESGAILMFDLKDAVYVIPLESINDQNTDDGKPVSMGMEPLSTHSKKSIVAFPTAWVEGFGGGYYQEKNTNPGRDICEDAALNINQPGCDYTCDQDQIRPTGSDELSNQIEVLMETMKLEVHTDE